MRIKMLNTDCWRVVDKRGWTRYIIYQETETLRLVVGPLGTSAPIIERNVHKRSLTTLKKECERDLKRIGY